MFEKLKSNYNSAFDGNIFQSFTLLYSTIFVVITILFVIVYVLQSFFGLIGVGVAISVFVFCRVLLAIFFGK